jgi:AcrR family transcriptional regulator
LIDFRYTLGILGAHMLRPSSRNLILDVAAQIASDHGASQLTIDAVAKRAGISKGGVMYHFPSKDDMLSALVDRVTQVAMARVSDSEARFGSQAFPMLDALIDECLRNDPQENMLFSGLLGAVANNPKLAEPAASAYSVMYRRIEAMGTMAPNALVVSLALDGLLFLRLLKLVDLDAGNVELLRNALKQLAQKPLEDSRTRNSSKSNRRAPRPQRR